MYIPSSLLVLDLCSPLAYCMLSDSKFMNFRVRKRISPHKAELPHVTRSLLIDLIGQVSARIVLNDVAVQLHLPT